MSSKHRLPILVTNSPLFVMQDMNNSSLAESRESDLVTRNFLNEQAKSFELGEFPCNTKNRIGIIIMYTIGR